MSSGLSGEETGDATVSHAAPHESALTDFESICRLLTSLLLHWPYAPDVQCPSIALCGPTGNGKSYLVHTVIDTLNTLHSGTAQSRAPATTTAEVNVRGATRRVHCVTPPLAAALAVRRNDGSTGLRRVLRQAVCASCCLDGTQGRLSDESTCVTHAVLLVLDHLQCFLSRNEADAQDGDAGDASPSNEDDAERTNMDAAGSPQGPLLADLYGVLRCNPPLFAAEEVRQLGLSSLVVVLLFSGHEAQLPRLLTEHAVDIVVTLPTPTTAERRDFFCRQLTQTSTTCVASEDASALYDALALRTGGIIYAGLVQIARSAATYMMRAYHGVQGATQACMPTTDEREANEHGEDNLLDMMQRFLAVADDDEKQTADAIAAAVAQKLVRQFQASRSPAAMEQRRSAGYVDVQTTRWSDVAGMADVKATLQRLVTGPLRHRNMYRHFGVRPSTGVLLHGPPGTGKTMLARAMATELNASFVYLDLPELLQAEVGESEKRLDDFFRAAQERSPAVLFIDELQAAFGARYDSVKSGKATKAPQTAQATAHDARLVSHLLHKLDEIHDDDEHTLLFVGATNVLHLLDPLLLRPGRLDTIIEVQLPDDAARGQLLQRIVRGEWATWLKLANVAQNARNIRQTQDLLVARFVHATEEMSGAEIRNAMSVFALQLTRHVTKTASAARLHTRRDNTQYLCKTIWSILQQEAHRGNPGEKNKTLPSVQEQQCLCYALQAAHLDNVRNID